MENYFKVECPKCQVSILIDRITGKIIEIREPLIPESTGDRFNDALKKAKAGPQSAEEKFNRSREDEKNKQKNLDDLFRKSMDQVKKEGPIQKQIRDIDLD